MDLLPNGNVQMQFIPDKTDGNTYTLVAKNVIDAESDFIPVFEFAPPKAKAEIAELLKKNFIDVTASLDENKLRSFALLR